MKKDLLDIRYREEYTRSYDTKYIAEVTHSGLNEYRLFSANEKYILNSKVNAYVSKLEEKWNKITIKQNSSDYKNASQKEAEVRTQEAVKLLKDVDNILIHTLSIDDTVDWETLKDKTSFNEVNPILGLQEKLDALIKPKKSIPLQIPQKPNYPFQPDYNSYLPKLSFLDKIIKSQADKKNSIANEQFDKALEIWKKQCQDIDINHADRLKEVETSNLSSKKKDAELLILHEDKLKKIRQEVENEVKNWEKQKEEFSKIQNENNNKVDELKGKYLNCDPIAVLEYCEIVLNNSQYPDSFPKSFQLDYNPENKILVVEYSLPTPENLPTLNEVKFLKDELKEYHISDAQIQKLFDATMYKITLRTIHELFEADKAEAVEVVSFNGWVNAINKATGKRENNCILSIQAKKEEFIAVDLEHVDPKTCFKNFKGVGSSKLSGLTAIQPILKVSRTDKRFTSHYEVASGIDSSTNLASMDWEDFEHLIREVFASEFSSNGGEVKVTQASRDGGVDAIAFDPDPIRGGKIVIQAKRYTNTVGVAAVRDLYGTVLNEGATKGILVTTADYGSDSYEFAKGKPLTLMNGSNLLYLLEKHGHKARIDIREAKIEIKK